MRFRLGIILAVASLSAGARAEGPSEVDTKALDQCVTAANAVDLAVKDCFAELAHKEDERLNRNWKRLMKAAGGPKTPEGDALLQEQRAWIAYKETACRHYLALGGTLDRLMGQMCYTNLITSRADELAALADFYTGSLRSD